MQISQRLDQITQQASSTLVNYKRGEVTPLEAGKVFISLGTELNEMMRTTSRIFLVMEAAHDFQKAVEAGQLASRINESLEEVVKVVAMLTADLTVLNPIRNTSAQA